MIYVRDFLNDQNIFESETRPRKPLVSIVLPTYSRCKGGFLERSISSVLSQTFTDFELLVMDDGSTDGSFDLIEKFRHQDSRVVHIRHENNCGLPGLRVNEGIELAQGQYLAFQFDDDLWRANALKALVSGAEEHSEPAVIVGRSLFSTSVGKHILPSDDIDIVKLYEQNRFANNAVLFPRFLVEQYGMYDPHIGMRRLCDWDLWLRLVKHVSFILTDEVVSDVFESNVGAIGVTVPWDMALFRYLNSIPRADLLTPSKWQNYELDSLKIGKVEVSNEFRQRLYEEQIVPYYFKFRHLFSGLSSFSATLQHTPLKTVLYTKQSYDVSNDVTISHYDALAAERESYKSYYQVLKEVKPGWVQEADLLLLMRTVEDQALPLVEQALGSNSPVGLYLDDDLLYFHEFGPKFDYLAPGTPYYQNLTQIITQVDAVLATNDYIGNSIRPLNPRVIPHNNTVLEETLPSEIRKRNAEQVRIGYVGTGYRIEEFKLIWDALVDISKEYKDRLVFEFWGVDVSSLPKLSSPVVQNPFTFSYQHYLASLQEANFDILLTPMLDHPKPRLGKSLIKYYETAVAGALGIFSDVPQYRNLPGGLTCLKAENTVDSWLQALYKAIKMSDEQFDLMRKRCLEHVREEFAVQAQIDLHEAALRATEFHAKTRTKRYEDGCPRVVYVLHSVHFGGAEIQLWRRLRLARKYGIQPIVVIPSVLKDSEDGVRLSNSLAQEDIQLEAVEYTCFTEPRSPAEFYSDLERTQIQDLLERCDPALVHTVTFIPSFGQICQEMNIPHLMTGYAVEDEFAWEKGQPDFVHCDVVQSDCLRYTKRWGQLLDSVRICARDMAPLNLFLAGQMKHLESIGQLPVEDAKRCPRLIVTGTFQERKRQLETIEAIGRLKKENVSCELHFYGYTHFFPNYMEKCHQAIKTWGLEDHVQIHGFSEDVNGILATANVLLSLSTYESFPGSIKDAIAAGALVVATPVGGVPELIIDNITGILCTGTSVEALVEGIRRALSLSPIQHQKFVEQARHIARLELHPYRTANDLFRLYNLALDINSAGEVYKPLPTSSPKAEYITSQRAKVKSPSVPPQSVMQVGSGLLYPFRPEYNNWSGLEVLVGTHMRPTSGQMTLTVRTQTGNALRVVSLDLINARDNDWLEFRFDPIKNSSNKQLLLEFSLLNIGPQTKVSLYQNSPNSRRGIYILRRLAQKLGLQLHGSNLHCREWYI